MTNIYITEAAKNYVSQKIKEENGLGLRLSIKKTGCSGYSYAPSIITEINEHDNVVTSEGFKVYLDTGWLDLLDGVEIDFVEENKSGLKQKKLVFNNAKEAGRCGCGESFHLET